MGSALQTDLLESLRELGPELDHSSEIGCEIVR
jgi:hypothetical protein